MRARRRTVALPICVALLAAGVGIVLAVSESAEATRVLAGRRAADAAVAQVKAPARAARPVKLPRVLVTVASHARVIKVPRSFLGLSTEYWTLPVFERHLSLFERVLSLIHVPGDGPLVIRVGGDSADHAFWNPRARRLPRWAFGLTPPWLRRTSTLVRATGLRLLLDLNLVTGSAAQAARWARAAEADLPRGSVIGFEIGNEADIYNRGYWLAAIGRTRLAGRPLPAAFSATSYTQEFHSYARMLAQAAPRVPLVGPAVANPLLDLSWISSLLEGTSRAVGIVSAHRYPYSACVRPSAPSYPTIARILSDDASAGVARSVRAAVRVADRAGIPFRLTELNSITCSGRPGVSDTFATALWAPDTVFELLRAGVDGVNLHTRAYAINAPFALGRTGLVPRPLLYGLILAARTLGPHGELLPVRLRAERGLRLKAWVVRTAGPVLRVLLLNKGYRAVRVTLRLPATGAAAVRRLLASAASSSRGVTLAGQRLGPDGLWQGPRVTETITPHAHRYVVTVPRVSAALLTVKATR
jgi:hypothetical protein